MPTIGEDAEIAFRVKGLPIYHVYKNDDMESGLTKEYWFCLHPESTETDGHGMNGHFDVRDLFPAGDYPSILTRTHVEALVEKAILTGKLHEAVCEDLVDSHYAHILANLKIVEQGGEIQVEPEPDMDAAVDVIRDLIDSADDTGCSDDLIVVDRALLAKLAGLAGFEVSFDLPGVDHRTDLPEPSPYD